MVLRFTVALYDMVCANMAYPSRYLRLSDDVHRQALYIILVIRARRAGIFVRITGRPFRRYGNARRFSETCPEPAHFAGPKF